MPDTETYKLFLYLPHFHLLNDLASIQDVCDPHPHTKIVEQVMQNTLAIAAFEEQMRMTFLVIKTHEAK